VIKFRDKDGSAMLDAARERLPPFSPDDVAVEFSELLKGYGIRKVTGDVREKSKSDIYRNLLPLLHSRNTITRAGAHRTWKQRQHRSRTRIA
jgi:hypothetical protein